MTDSVETEEAVTGASKDEIFLKNLKLNNSIREIFFNRFVHIFSSYDHFVIQPDQVFILFIPNSILKQEIGVCM
jgi:hypothetical protein